MNNAAIKMLKLECPNCRCAIPVLENQQTEGELIGCPNCGAELVLERVTEPEGQNWHWALMDLEEDAGNEN